MSLLAFVIRTRLRLTSRKRATRWIQDELEKTLALEPKQADPDEKRCPEILGVDEDMRDWNFFQILEHNTIVNGRITGLIDHLCGNGPAPDPNFNTKTDVMPRPDAGPEQIPLFVQSVNDHLMTVARYEYLRRSPLQDHPRFGPFTAHQWHAMFAFHLQLHRKQAEAILG